MDGVVQISADAPVEMLAGMADAMGNLGCPPLGRSAVAVRIELSAVQPPRGRPQDGAQGLQVDIALGGPVSDWLKGGQRPAELLPLHGRGSSAGQGFLRPPERRGRK